jgi:hypothetical protein
MALQDEVISINAPHWVSEDTQNAPKNWSSLIGNGDGELAPHSDYSHAGAHYIRVWRVFNAVESALPFNLIRC